MSDLLRFGVAIEQPLLELFDQHIARRGYESRSEALRDLIRAELAREAWDRGDTAAATISLIYDHHVHHLTEHLNSIQHDFGAQIVCTTHVHLDHHHCLEVIVAKGSSTILKRLADKLLGTKGVLSGSVAGLNVVAPKARKPKT